MADLEGSETPTAGRVAKVGGFPRGPGEAARGKCKSGAPAGRSIRRQGGAERVRPGEFRLDF